MVLAVCRGFGTARGGQSREVCEVLPESLAKWLSQQEWERDTDGPIVSLGKSGAFDDTHLFAPCVAYEKDRYLLWYCGSSGAVDQRVFRLGLAQSGDGKSFEKSEANPVFGFGDGKHSVLTPTILCHPDGAVLREDGKLRMWFSASQLTDENRRHTLHETASADGIHWSRPSAAQLKHVYAPTVIEDEEHYRMWFTDVSGEPWIFRHAESGDGKSWRVTAEPVLTVDQEWEQSNLFYPTVRKIDNAYLMWYGSYWAAHKDKTAIGFAVSLDGLCFVQTPIVPGSPTTRRVSQSCDLRMGVGGYGMRAERSRLS